MSLQISKFRPIIVSEVDIEGTKTVGRIEKIVADGRISRLTTESVCFIEQLQATEKMTTLDA
jgi:hypothetical protein